MVSLFSALRISLSREPPFSYSLSSLIQKGRRVAINSLEKKCRYLSSLAEIDEPENDGVQDDIKETEKDTALHLALSQLAGESDSESTMSLQRFFGTRQVPVISTGSLKLDLALGTGGLPRGRFVEIYGQEACGKTTLALHIIKEAQKLGGTCAYFDAENAMDPSLAESMGIDIENLIVSRPNTAENLLSAVDTLAKSGSVDVIVVDSVAALVPQYEVDVSIGEVRKDLLSTIMSKGLRKIHYSLSDSETLVVFVNQIRINSQLKQGSEHAVEETCGGNALKFYAAVRLRIKRTGLLKTEDEVTGLGISIQVMKNKLAPAMKKADLGLIFGRGFCSVSEVLDLGCEYGLIMNEGSAYHIEGEVFSDQLEVKHYLAENKEVFDKMDMAAFNCLALIQGRHGQCYLDPESLTLLKEALSLKTVIEAELRNIVLKACTPTGTKNGLLMVS